MNGGAQPRSPDRVKEWLHGALSLSKNDTLFPWQEELLTRFSRGTIEPVVDVPTGLGKTAVMAIWLVARACGAALPRRLVYVVDRRAVVDQATDVAIGLREYVERTPGLQAALGLQDRQLPISTLRGQHVDNREWLEDPASPAILVGTVDMIGSRLLFEGYGVSRKMRPYHAGLLGADTLVVLDEAHLVPPFERLLDAIAEGSVQFGPREEADRKVIPPFRLMSLSATGTASSDKAFGLTDRDLEPGSITRKRLDAPKRLTFVPLSPGDKLPAVLAHQAWELADHGKMPIRCVVFCDKREDAVAAKAATEKLAEGNTPTELLVGGRRVFERQAASERLRKLGFLAGADVQRKQPAFLFATSAGEVGIDLDADHMVADLVAWERMVQRLGRVNRRGEGNAKVVVVTEVDSDKSGGEAQKKRSEQVRERLAAFEQALRRLPPDGDNSLDASPRAIRNLKLQAETDPELRQVLDAATTPVPLRPALTRAVVDAWSMTSLKEHTGRPDIGPWLRGWLPDDPPQTTVVWRRYLPARVGATDQVIEEFFEAAPPHMSELLETETDRVLKWLNARGKILMQDLEQAEVQPLRKDNVAGIVLSPSGDLKKILALEDLEDALLKQILPGATVVVDARVAGLTDGLLDDKASRPSATVDGGEWLPDVKTTSGEIAPVIRFRVVMVSKEEVDGERAKNQWRVRCKFATDVSEEGEETRWLVVYKWRHDGATEDDRSIGRPQLLDIHEEWAELRARDLTGRLGLPEPYVEMLAVAARLHDEGKRPIRWQRAARAPSDGIYGKTRGPMNPALLDGYRHEFGSFLSVKEHPRLAGLPQDLMDLALHLITAHHGSARPTIRIDGCEEAPPSALEEQAGEVALRFARLQKRWGPWGLAWWEALLRAADQQASRENDETDATDGKENA